MESNKKSIIKREFEWHFADVYLQAMSASTVLMNDREFYKRYTLLKEYVEEKIAVPNFDDAEVYVVTEYSSEN